MYAECIVTTKEAKKPSGEDHPQGEELVGELGDEVVVGPKHTQPSQTAESRGKGGQLVAR